MKTYTYIDNSNLFIEGRRASAVQKGMAPNIYDAMNHRILDFSWEVSYRDLHNFLCGRNKTEIGGANCGALLHLEIHSGITLSSKGFRRLYTTKIFKGRKRKLT